MKNVSGQARLVMVPMNGQITIGKKWAGRQIRIEPIGEGELRIVSGTFVPDGQATFFTSDAARRLEDFNQWSKERPPQMSDSKSLKSRFAKKDR